MRIKGKELQNRYSKTVQLARPDGSSWEFQISPLRLGFHQILNERGVVPPSVPTKISRDSNGKPIRDSDGLAVMQADQNETEYLKAVEIYHRRIALLVLWEGLQNDPDVEFETAAPEDQTGWLSFADQLHDELEHSAWTAGDLIWMCEQIAEMSNLTNQHFRDAQQDFFESGDATKLNVPRTLEYFIFCVCERFGWKVSEFRKQRYQEQVQYLAFELLRQRDEQNNLNS